MSRVKRTIDAWVILGVCVTAAALLQPRGLAGQAPVPGQAPAPAQAPAAPAPAPQAPAPPAPEPPVVVGPSVQTATDGGQLKLLAGRSLVLNTTFDIRRFSITNTAVADGTVVSPREFLIDGKAAGTISVILWGPAERIHYELVVEPSVTTLEQRLHDLFPGEDIKVSVSEGAVVLSGRASTNDVMLRAAEIAGSSLPNQRVINMLQLPGGTVSQQVMLQVRFAEVNHRAVQELGLTLFTTRAAFTARSTTQQFPAPDFDDEAGAVQGLTFSDYLNIFFFQRNEGIGGVMKALQQDGNLESLAEPNLIAYNGQEASFLAGGEIPIPVVSGTTGNVSVAYKEFGIRLKFRPTIAGDVIRLHVRPEVSTLDFANGVTLSGFRIPALQTRYAETEVELRDGQSFAVAGLLNNIGQNDRMAIPWLSQIPIIGNIFKSRAQRRETTELLVLITPRLVRPLNPDEVPPLPTIQLPGGTGTPAGAVGTTSRNRTGGLVDAPATVQTR
jgi:pilus assembly protein CpaC